MVAAQESLYSRKRKDLLRFAEKYPGGLAAHFLHPVRRKLHREPASDSRDILSTDATVGATSQSELKDVRDVREIQFLSKLLSDVSVGRLPQAVDHVAMRIRELRAAKLPGGSWDKAAAISPQPQSVPANAPLPDGAFTL